MKRRIIFDNDVSNKINKEFDKWQEEGQSRYQKVYDKFRNSLDIK